MGLSAKFVRTQLQLYKPLMDKLDLDACRAGQTRIGELMQFLHRKDVTIHRHHFAQFEGAWVLPKDKRRQGVILYLHGGGFTCGDLDYALGFASTLAVKCGSQVFSPAYRLAPEHPFPAALEDALEAYQYLLHKGYASREICLCGESAGGGLCYSLCLLLKEKQLPLPGGIIAISPWTDLTASGASYQDNLDRDPSMSPALLSYYTTCYTDTPGDPLVSPLFGKLEDLPPSLIFVGSDELLLDDAQRMHDALLNSNCKSQLVIAPDRWHVYVLYDLNENREDYSLINRFLTQHTCPEIKLRWMRLDNAAKIYPASRSSTWSSVFRLSATLKEPIDTAVMENALDITVRRFPSICVRLRKGLFWYYLEQLPHAPKFTQEGSFPLMPMTKQDVRTCAFRVIVYENRLAVEFFHSLTDGTGGMVFLKTLLAEYIQQKYGIEIHAGNGVLGRLDQPSAEELEDSFLKYAGTVTANRRESNAWKPSGTPEPDGYHNLLCVQLQAKAVLSAAHEQGVSVTSYLTAAMLQALLELQKEKIPNRSFRRPVRVQLPVNLRRLFPSNTLRNFAYFTTPGVDPRLGDYSFAELCKLVHHHMGSEVTAKKMGTEITSNVSTERNLLVRAMPLFLKNIAMKTAFLIIGESKMCLCMSNLGVVTLPEEMLPFVERMDFILAPQASAPHNCGLLSFGDTLYINFIRNIREPELEAHFCEVLRQQGLRVTVESNQRS